MPFEFTHLSLTDVILITPRVFSDPRGLFLETYKRSDFERVGIRDLFVQDNHSRSMRGVLRGLHYQRAPHAQGKLIHCISGSILDVAVDIRRGSPTFAKWVSAELNAEGHQLLYVPPGFAHGFLVLSDAAEVVYKCTAEYAPDLDRGIIWNDPDIGIVWPVRDPLLSEKDARLPLLRDTDSNLTM